MAGRARSGVAQNVAEELRLAAQLTEQNDKIAPISARFAVLRAGTNRWQR